MFNENEDESSVLVTVIKVLLIVGTISMIGSCLNEDYHSRGGVFIDSTPTKHWLYK
jgi:hypothetical protein